MPPIFLQAGVLPHGGFPPPKLLPREPGPRTHPEEEAKPSLAKWLPKELRAMRKEKLNLICNRLPRKIPPEKVKEETEGLETRTRGVSATPEPKRSRRSINAADPSHPRPPGSHQKARGKSSSPQGLGTTAATITAGMVGRDSPQRAWTSTGRPLAFQEPYTCHLTCPRHPRGRFYSTTALVFFEGN